MRYLLLILFFTLQTFGFGAKAIDLKKSDVKKVLTLEKSNLKEPSYYQFRYYSPDIGMYISQDPIGLAGGMPNLYSYVHNSNSWVDPFGLMELFRSMSRAEYFDNMANGWDGKEDMGSKWFAESYDDAVEWGHTMGHGDDSKFYVVGFEVDDAVANDAYKVKNLDGIGDARAIDVDALNGNTTKTTVSSHRVKCN